MAPGVYTGAVYVLPFGGTGVPQTIPVTMFVSTIGTLTANPSFLTFTYQLGGAVPTPQTVTVVNALGGASRMGSRPARAVAGTGSVYPLQAQLRPLAFWLVSLRSLFTVGTYYGSPFILREARWLRARFR
jgi:hypothetical protein